MSLSVNPYPNVHFGSKQLPKNNRILNFISGQMGHLVYQGGIIAESECLKPSSSIGEFVIRKLFFDFVENAMNNLNGIKITAKKQCLNILSWATDGMRALDKIGTNKKARPL